MPFRVSQTKEGVILQVHVAPGSKSTEIMGLYGESLKIKLKAPPVEGKANEELIAFLSELFSIPKSSVQIVKGQSSRSKTVLIKGISKDYILKILA